MSKAPKTDLNDPSFHDENAARERLERLLWPNGPVCPRCHVGSERIVKMEGKTTRPGLYNCRDCRKPFTVTVGTVFERSHIPLHKWLLAGHFLMCSKKGMSALQLSRMLGVTYEAAWFMFHRLRECAKVDPSGPLGGSNKVVEVDETYIGGKARNKAYGPAPKKHAVVALVERDGGVRSFHVANVDAKTLRPIVVKHASRKSYLMTDESGVYPKMGDEFAGHGTVNHSANEYVRSGGFIHSNSVESYFALLKRGVYGTFHSISEAHLPRYLAEFDFRLSHRKLSDTERGEALLSHAKGKRLMYRQPDETKDA